MASLISSLPLPKATQEPAVLANALLRNMRAAPASVLSELFADVEHAKEPAAPKLLPRDPGFGGPTGLGTSAARLASSVREARRAEAQMTVNTVAARMVGAPTGLGTSGLTKPTPVTPSVSVVPEPGEDDDEMPELFCPGPVRDDRTLGELVNEQMVKWAEEVGIYPGRLDRLRAANFGRLIMLAHPGTDDPDRLLAATKMAVAEWASDDYYLDEEEVGANPVTAAARFALIYAVVDPIALPARYAPRIDEFIQDEPIAKAHRSAIKHLAQYTTQLTRWRNWFQHQSGHPCIQPSTRNASWQLSKHRPKIWGVPDPPRAQQLPAADDPGRPCRWPTTNCRPRSSITRACATPYLWLRPLRQVLPERPALGRHESADNYSLPGLIVTEEGCSPKEAVKAHC